MLTKGDEYPIHQTPEPVAFSGSDRNFYDRYFFNGYSADGSVFFAAAFGVYPHLNVMDGAVSILKDGVQKSIHVSRLLGMERMDTQVGPLKVQVIEELKQIRLTLEETEGIALDVQFTGRHFPIEEPRFTYRQGPRMLIDCTRMTQNGHWQGTLSVDGDAVEEHRTVLIDGRQALVLEAGQYRGVDRVHMHRAARLWTQPVQPAMQAPCGGVRRAGSGQGFRVVGIHHDQVGGLDAREVHQVGVLVAHWELFLGCLAGSPVSALDSRALFRSSALNSH